MNLNATDWVLGADYAAAPTCATCHMSGNLRNGGRITHDPGERISWSVRTAAIDRPSTLRFAAIGYRSEQKENGDVLFQVERTIEAGAVTEFDFSYSVPESVRWILSFAEVESDEGGRTRVERLAIQRE